MPARKACHDAVRPGRLILARIAEDCRCTLRFGDWKNGHKRFSRWAQTGVWERVFKYLAADADNEYAMMDSTIVRAHQHSAGALKKRSG